MELFKFIRKGTLYGLLVGAIGCLLIRLEIFHFDALVNVFMIAAFLIVPPTLGGLIGFVLGYSRQQKIWRAQKLSGGKKYIQTSLAFIGIVITLYIFNPFLFSMLSSPLNGISSAFHGYSTKFQNPLLSADNHKSGFGPSGPINEMSVTENGESLYFSSYEELSPIKFGSLHVGKIAKVDRSMKLDFSFLEKSNSETVPYSPLEAGIFPLIWQGWGKKPILVQHRYDQMWYELIHKANLRYDEKNQIRVFNSNQLPVYFPCFKLSRVPLPEPTIFRLGSQSGMAVFGSEKLRTLTAENNSELCPVYFAENNEGDFLVGLEGKEKSFRTTATYSAKLKSLTLDSTLSFDSEYTIEKLMGGRIFVLHALQSVKQEDASIGMQLYGSRFEKILATNLKNVFQRFSVSEVQLDKQQNLYLSGFFSRSKNSVSESYPIIRLLAPNYAVDESFVSQVAKLKGVASGTLVLDEEHGCLYTTVAGQLTPWVPVKIGLTGLIDDEWTKQLNSHLSADSEITSLKMFQGDLVLGGDFLYKDNDKKFINFVIISNDLSVSKAYVKNFDAE